MARFLPLALVVLLLAGCAATPQAVPAELSTRLADIDTAIVGWQGAGDLAEAQRYAEAARNLIVGPDGPYYGDADGDGTIEGANTQGLLPGLTGEAGLASDVDGACVERDIRGGSWDDAADRWATLDTAISEWSPTNNTFPSLPSHPQRIVGWATHTLATSSVDEAHEFGGHAHLHIDVSLAAITACV
jgi:opacity protein-like surface antigen